MGIRQEGCKLTPQGEGDDQHRDFNEGEQAAEAHLTRPGQMEPKVQGFRFLCTSAQSLGIKKEELELLISTEGYDLVCITETWWGDFHEWNVVVDGYELFKRK